MSPQETQVLQNFLDQLVQVSAVSPDPQAQTLIQQAVSKQPHASYLLVQRALLLEQALADANSQIAALQADLREQKALNQLNQQTNSQTSQRFLDAGNTGWGNSAVTRPTTATSSLAANAYPPATPSTPAWNPAPAAGSGLFGQSGSMLGTVAATAAGVAAGAFLYQGISHMMGGAAQHGLASGQPGAASLSNNDGGLQPGYFDQNQPFSSPLESLDQASIPSLDDNTGLDGSDLDVI
ncbi:DUF2076 family protein [Undibacterium sp. CY7W]|uniref:DUF2076 family protein n=1 Tax=Undibacterium rugosum TaxID=2762291 RepID=A0A923HXJ4_9BURK|nr:DUF2076 family protein [Undibacterium rugosum]MBC3933811.1 DUF2076 family protein [Undibacterium rugosum]